MQNLIFRPIDPFDIGHIQAMVQGSESCHLPFKCFSKPFFVATCQGNIVGFTFGQEGHGEDSKTLTILGSYLRMDYADDNHLHELQLAFINWANEKLGVTHYKLDKSDTPKPIGISYFILPQSVDLPVPEGNLIHGIEYAEREFAPA